MTAFPDSSTWQGFARIDDPPEKFISVVGGLEFLAKMEQPSDQRNTKQRLGITSAP